MGMPWQGEVDHTDINTIYVVHLFELFTHQFGESHLTSANLQIDVSAHLEEVLL